jgi:type II secretory pathway component PulF
MASGYGPVELSGALRRAAQGYRQRAQRTADWLTIYLPILLAVVVGGTATLIYALAVLGPWYQLLYEWA